MLARSLIKRMSNKDRNLIKERGAILTLLNGGFAFFNYCEYIKKDLMHSEGRYRFNSST